MAKDIESRSDRTVEVQAHTRSAPASRGYDSVTVNERATFVETADASIAEYERTTHYEKRK